MSALYALVLLAKDTGEAQELWLRRGTCHRQCWQAGLYEVRGTRIVVLRRFKVSPYVARRRDVVERRIDGRSWAAEDLPLGETMMVGCDHEQNDAVFGPGPVIRSWSRIT